MKKMRGAILLFTFLFVAGITSSCDSDNDFKGENGKPSSLKDGNNQRILFSYGSGGKKITQIKEIQGTIWSFNYEGDVLSSISFSPEDKRVADGHAFTKFIKEGDKIIIEQSGEPSSSVYKQELELDNNGIPVKITDIGVYTHTGTNGEITKEREGEFYSEFTYDPTTKNLLKQTVYNKATSKATASYSYEYDNKPGVISKLDLPLWFYAFYAYSNKGYNTNNYDRIFSNYSNNVIKETVTNIAEGTQPNVINYNLQYNKDNFPTTIGNDLFGGLYFSISY